MSYALWFAIIDGTMRTVGALHTRTRFTHREGSLEDVAWAYEGRHAISTEGAPATRLAYTTPIHTALGQYLTTDWVIDAHTRFNQQLENCERAFHTKALRERGVFMPLPTVRSVGLSDIETFQEKIEDEVEALVVVYQQMLDDLRRLLSTEIAFYSLTTGIWPTASCEH
jgi:hypothetical protein